MKNITLKSSTLKTLTTLALAASSLFAGSALANNAQDNGWVQTHTAQETYLNSRHLYCDYMDLESAKAECEDHNECNGFNFRVSDHTVCFKAADTNANGEALPEYHATGTGYDVWVKTQSKTRLNKRLTQPVTAVSTWAGILMLSCASFNLNTPLRKHNATLN